MYIEQGYKGDIGLWKYFVISTGFIGLIIVNYIFTVNSSIDVDVAMAQMIDKFGTNLFFIMALAPLVAGLFLILGWTFFVHKQSIKSLTTSRKKIDWKRVFFSFLFWGSITVTLTLIDILVSPDNYVLNFNALNFFVMAIIAIILVPLQTSFEEYLFRGHLMQGLGILVKNRWFPLIITSTIFGLLHMANPEVENGFHAANNLLTALLVTADWTAFQTDSIYKDISDPILGWEALVPVFVVFPILLYVFSKKYKWTNWKERLFGKVLSKEEFLTLENENSPRV